MKLISREVKEIFSHDDFRITITTKDGSNKICISKNNLGVYLPKDIESLRRKTFNEIHSETDFENFTMKHIENINDTLSKYIIHGLYIDGFLRDLDMNLLPQSILINAYEFDTLRILLNDKNKKILSDLGFEFVYDKRDRLAYAKVFVEDFYKYDSDIHSLPYCILKSLSINELGLDIKNDDDDY